MSRTISRDAHPGGEASPDAHRRSYEGRLGNRVDGKAGGPTPVVCITIGNAFGTRECDVVTEALLCFSSSGRMCPYTSMGVGCVEHPPMPPSAPPRHAIAQFFHTSDSPASCETTTLHVFSQSIAGAKGWRCSATVAWRCRPSAPLRSSNCHSRSNIGTGQVLLRRKDPTANFSAARCISTRASRKLRTAGCVMPFRPPAEKRRPRDSGVMRFSARCNGNRRDPDVFASRDSSALAPPSDVGVAPCLGGQCGRDTQSARPRIYGGTASVTSGCCGRKPSQRTKRKGLVL